MRGPRRRIELSGPAYYTSLSLALVVEVLVHRGRATFHQLPPLSVVRATSTERIDVF